MKRYTEDVMDGLIQAIDGEWIRYADHVEAMKRIAGDERPVAWYEADSNCRGAQLRDLLSGPMALMHSSRWHWQAERPDTSNPVWPIFAAPSASREGA